MRRYYTTPCNSDIELQVIMPTPNDDRTFTTDSHSDSYVARSPPPAYEEASDMSPPPPAFMPNPRSAPVAYSYGWIDASDGRRQRTNVLHPRIDPPKTRGFGNIALLVVFAIVVAATIGGALADRRVREKSVWA
jgi:hypothetical protein